MPTKVASYEVSLTGLVDERLHQKRVEGTNKESMIVRFGQCPEYSMVSEALVIPDHRQRLQPLIAEWYMDEQLREASSISPVAAAWRHAVKGGVSRLRP